MISPFIIGLAALLLQFWDYIFRPSSARCPQGWFVEGVRPNGATRCLPAPPPNCGEPVPPNDQPCAHDDRSLERRITCDAGEQPIVEDERSIRCVEARTE